MRIFLRLAVTAAAMLGVQSATAHDEAAACIAGPYMVFFDSDSDEITSSSAAILDNAVMNYLTCGDAQVMLSGHTDTMGSDDYNVSLSQRMANNVRAYLSARGISDAVITTEAFGESRLLVETADNVRELQNRRVEIVFGPGSGW